MDIELPSFCTTWFSFFVLMKVHSKLLQFTLFNNKNIHLIINICACKSMLRNVSRFMMSTVNPNEMSIFKELTQWWHPNGPMQILYTYNYERVKFLRKFVQSENVIRPLNGQNILDVGCGAGFLAESMTRLGGNVIGLDPNPTSFHEATAHQSSREDLKNLSYVNRSLEEYQEEKPQNLDKFDIVTSMEVIQHVDNPQQFVDGIAKSTRNNGLIMLSTIKRSLYTWVTHILLAEKITRIVPSGTHTYEKFINPGECEKMLKNAGVETLEVLALDLNWKGEFQESKEGGNYLIMGRKKEKL